MRVCDGREVTWDGVAVRCITWSGMYGVVRSLWWLDWRVLRFSISLFIKPEIHLRYFIECRVVIGVVVFDNEGTMTHARC